MPLEVGAPDRLGAGFQEQQQADGRDHRVQAAAVAQGMEHQPFGQRGEEGDAGRRSQHRDPVVGAPRTHEMEGDEGACHVEGTVREIRHLQDAVDQREAQGHQAVDAAERQPVEHLLKEEFHEAGKAGTAAKLLNVGSPAGSVSRAGDRIAPSKGNSVGPPGNSARLTCSPRPRQSCLCGLPAPAA
jgi:hypothetical protein